MEDSDGTVEGTSAHSSTMKSNKHFSKGDDNDESDEFLGLSKTQRKKLLKKRKREETKIFKRKQEKEKKKAKKLALKDAGIVATKKRTVSMAHSDACSVQVALDLSFNHLMTEKDQRKVVKQVLWSYSANRHSKHPLQLYLTNFDEGNRTLFGRFSPGYKSWDIHISEKNHIGTFEKEEIVYLSSESSDVLKELDDKKVYIIGGLVDHNAHKGLCFRLAEEAGISHARLPIDEYVKLEGRKILPINHVFEILLHFAEHSDWEKAFYSVIPKRKGLRTLEQCAESEPIQDTEVSETIHNDNDSKRSNQNSPENLDDSSSSQESKVT